MQLILAEKPSVARDLARVLGARAGRGGAGTIEVDKDRVITWCVGHLVELDEPASYDARWKAWRLDTLPMLPEHFRLRPVQSSADQLAHVRRLMRDGRFTEVVNACDAGREGELIFRYVYELAGCTLPVRRLWISSLTDEAIRQGFARLRPGRDYDALGDAARCRSEADWLVGLNATRAVTVRHRTGGDSPLYSIGRVQTPTLALVVARDRAIAAFVPTPFWEVKGKFATAAGEGFEALWTVPAPSGRGRGVTRLGAAPLADDLIARLLAASAGGPASAPVVEKVQGKRTREAPPLLFDLTSLQRTANRRFGLSAARTLEIAQALYETHKVLTYPRTDSRYLSRDLGATLPKLFGSLAGHAEYRAFAERLRDEVAEPASLSRMTANRRVFDDGKVADHHAIIPTGKSFDLAGLSRDERRLFDLVARRFLAAFYPEAEFAATEVVVRVGQGDGKAPVIAVAPKPEKPPAGDKGADKDDEPEAEILPALPPPPDRFVARGRVRLVAGWQEVAGFGGEGGAGAGADEGPALPVLTEGQALSGDYAAVARQTRPPPPLTEATLLAAMETAGRTIADEELRAAMKESGLGTPATRAATIETLIKRGFMLRAGKNLASTETGRALIQALPVPSLASPELTGRWEARLSRIARGLETRPAFMADIAGYVAEVVAAVRSAPVNAIMSRPGPPRPPSPAHAGPSEPLPAAAPPSNKMGPSPRTPSSPPAPRSSRARPSSEKPAARERRGPPGSAGATRSRSRAPAAAAAGAAGGTSASAPASLTCPRCKQGTLVTGKRGWGCSRWREGCGFVVWFDLFGKRLSEAQLRELIDKGHTRKVRWPRPKDAGKGEAAAGRLVLDPKAPADGAVRFEPA
jgi:DNA topoisomerase-3